jgi:hypothetical protein
MVLNKWALAPLTFSFIREAFVEFIGLLFFKSLLLSCLWGTVRYRIGRFLGPWRLGLVRSGTRCEGFFAVLERGPLLEESLKEDVDILLSLVINGIAYGVVRGWRGVLVGG